jgi:hypothetical protein
MTLSKYVQVNISKKDLGLGQPLFCNANLFSFLLKYPQPLIFCSSPLLFVDLMQDEDVLDQLDACPVIINTGSAGAAHPKMTK